MKFKIESIKHQTEAVHKTLEALRGGKQRIDIEMETFANCSTTAS